MALLLLLPLCGNAADLDALQLRAANMHLSQSREWLALGHYMQNRLHSGWTSDIASPDFFLAPDGRHDPAAELRATLAVFARNGKGKRHARPAQCVYRGRFIFLQRKLGLDAARIPMAACPKFRHWRSDMAAQSVSLVFASAYLANPASMFGHTMLRIDSAKSIQSSLLLSHAVNFAAHTRDDKGVIFAWKGLTGGFSGVYGMAPYYQKIKQYARIENRDLWSYQLQLSKAEIGRLIAHLWAMRGVHFNYYFINKNCAYQLLSLLQVARPSLHLLDSFRWYVLPADTLRALAAIPGLMGPAQRRPSARAQLEHETAALGPGQRQLVKAIATGRTPADSAALTGLADKQRAQLLSAASDYLQYRRRSGAVSAKQAASRGHTILLARSRTPVGQAFAPLPAPGASPAAAQPPARLGLSASWGSGGFSLGLQLRPLYHDFLDPSGGYANGQRIDAFAAQLRYSPARSQLKLAHLTLLDIASLRPRSALFKPLSWRMNTGWRRLGQTVFGSAATHLGYYLQGGPGLAWGHWKPLTAYVFALGSADINSGFTAGYGVGVGASAGVLVRLRADWNARAEVGDLQYLAGGGSYKRWGYVAQQLSLAGPIALHLRVGWEEIDGHGGQRFEVGLRGYF